MPFDLPRVRGKYRKNYSLKRMSWFGVGGDAEVVFIPQDFEDLQYFLENKSSDIRITSIGVGSNTLIREGGVNGVVIRLGNGFNCIHHDENFIYVGAATLDMNLALYSRDYSFGDLEFLAGIPGTIGGALAMNAGAYGNDIASVLHSAKAVDRNNGERREFSVKEMGYQYRGKSLSDEWIFTEGVFRYTLSDKEEIAKKVKEIQEKRILTQPIKSRTGGSTFKNPDAAKAWKLIDNAGCRGLKMGGAQISEQHCNFIINTGDASAMDIEQLILTVQDRVLENSGIKLEPEIKIIGEKC